MSGGGARERILARTRAAIGAGADPDARRARVRDRLEAPSQSAPIPEIGRRDGDARLSRFIAAAEAVEAKVTRIADLSELPGALASALRERNLGPAIRLGADPAFAGLDWEGVEVSHGPGRLEEPATLSRAVGGVAETGTLMLYSGPANPVTLTFLGETHFVVLDADAVEAGLEGAWARFRRDAAEEGADPRTVNFVTGPSRTADIEQTLELGAHGPVALHIILVGDSEG